MRTGNSICFAFLLMIGFAALVNADMPAPPDADYPCEKTVTIENLAQFPDIVIVNCGSRFCSDFKPEDPKLHSYLNVPDPNGNIPCIPCVQSSRTSTLYAFPKEYFEKTGIDGLKFTPSASFVKRHHGAREMRWWETNLTCSDANAYRSDCSIDHFYYPKGFTDRTTDVNEEYTILGFKDHKMFLYLSKRITLYTGHAGHDKPEIEVFAKPEIEGLKQTIR